MSGGNESKRAGALMRSVGGKALLVAGFVLALAPTIRADFIVDVTQQGHLWAPGGFDQVSGQFTQQHPVENRLWQFGDTYQLIFVTAGVRDAISSNIADYNAFVNAEAALSSLPGVADVTWYAIGSTTTVHARDNAVVSAPVYRLDGAMVAAGFDPFYSGPLTGAWAGVPNTPNRDQHGATRNTEVWTGSNRQGLQQLTRQLATSNPRYGGSNNSQNYLDLFNTQRLNTVQLPMYAMSEVLTIVPEPGTGLLLLIGGNLLLLIRRRKRG